MWPGTGFDLVPRSPSKAVQMPAKAVIATVGTRPYSGGRSSLLSQPAASPVMRGSGRSHCSHRKERGPLPPGANARRISEPHCGHLMALGVRSMP
jgi:hypothetical protein